MAVIITEQIAPVDFNINLLFLICGWALPELEFDGRLFLKVLESRYGVSFLLENVCPRSGLAADLLFWLPLLPKEVSDWAAGLETPSLPHHYRTSGAGLLLLFILVSIFGILNLCSNDFHPPLHVSNSPPLPKPPHPQQKKKKSSWTFIPTSYFLVSGAQMWLLGNSVLPWGRGGGSSGCGQRESIVPRWAVTPLQVTPW